jgi:excisionase family DNA binding protein
VVNRRLLTADEVADRIGMSAGWVWKETRAGRIPHVALGRYYRYRPEAIEDWLRDIESSSVRDDNAKTPRRRSHAPGPA